MVTGLFKTITKMGPAKSQRAFYQPVKKSDMAYKKTRKGKRSGSVDEKME